MAGVIAWFLIIDALLFSGFIWSAGQGMDKLAGALIIAFGIVTAVGAFLIGTGLMFGSAKALWKEMNK